MHLRYRISRTLQRSPCKREDMRGRGYGNRSAAARAGDVFSKASNTKSTILYYVAHMPVPAWRNTALLIKGDHEQMAKYGSRTADRLKSARRSHQRKPAQAGDDRFRLYP